MHTSSLVYSMVLAIASLSVRADGPNASRDLVERAPTIQILLDNSGGSPATDSDFMTSAWPVIEAKLRGMPLGSVVIVNSVGNASLKPVSMRARIQRKATTEGASIEEVVQAVRADVLGFPKRSEGKEHAQSHLVGGIFDAARNINPKASSPNVIVFLSDLIEFSPLANCYKVKTCRLPTPTFKLESTDVIVLGVGRGLPSDQEIALFAAWEKFFTQAGATYTLKKTF